MANPHHSPYTPAELTAPWPPALVAAAGGVAGALLGWGFDVVGPAGWPNPMFLLVPPALGALAWQSARRGQRAADHDVLLRHYQEATVWRDRYAGILDLTYEGALVAHDGRIILANQAARTLFAGEHARDLVGREVGDLLPDLSAAMAFGPIKRRIRGRNLGVCFALQARTLDGTAFDAEMTCNLLIDGAQQIALYTVRDVTDDNQARQGYKTAIKGLRGRVEQLERGRSEFLTDMSAEIRGPLQQIRERASGLLARIRPDGQRGPRQDLENIAALSGNVQVLLDRILDLALIDAGSLRITPAASPVEPLAREVIEAARPLAASHRNRLSLEVGDGLEVLADRARLRQILVDLVGNACRFTDDGEVRVEVRAEHRSGDRWLSFEVSDTGRGMSPDQLSRLFQPFVRVDPTVHGKLGGAGLSLAVDRQVARMMGGEIRVRSVAGEGSTFTLLLPSWDADFEAPAAPPERVRAFLVLEESPAPRRILDEIAAAASYTVQTAVDADAAARLAAREPPRHLAVDLRRLVRDGPQDLVELAADPAFDGVPSLWMSWDESRDRGNLLVLRDLLTTPIGENRLARALSPYGSDDQPILVVQPDGAMRELLCRMIERQGWKVQSASTGGLAMQHVTQEPPAAIVVDLGDPDGQGLPFLVGLQGSEHLQDVPVFGFVSPDAMQPHQREELETAVRAILREGHADRRTMRERIRAAITGRRVREVEDPQEATRLMMAEPDMLATMILKMPGLEDEP